MRAKIHRYFSITHTHGLRDLNGMMDTTERVVQTQRLLELSKQVQRWAICLSTPERNCTGRRSKSAPFVWIWPE